MTGKAVLAGLFILALAAVAVEADDIHEAVQKGDLTRVRALLDADRGLVDRKDPVFGRTPLHWAARGVHLDILRLLLDRGADPRLTDNSGITALHSVAARGHNEAAGLLLAKGADVNAADAFGKTPLVYAISGVHTELIVILVAKGGTVPVRGEAGRRLLHDAASHGDGALVQWLAERGVDLLSENGNGGTLLHSLSEGGLKEFIPALVEKGLDVRAKDRYGFTPLHYAAKKGQKGVVGILLGYGADPNAANLAGERPIHLTRRAGQDDLVEMFVTQGADQGPPRFPSLKGAYLGYHRPGEKPKIFACGIISSVDWEHSPPDFSPDGREVFWTSVSDGMRILQMKLEGGEWTAPRLAPFSGFEDGYPRFSPDGRRLFFVSYRPLNDGRKNVGMGINLWSVERSGERWSEPRPVGPPFDNGNIFGFSMTDDGTIYFTDAGSGFDIYRSRLVAGRYAGAEKLGGTVNSADVEDEPFVAPNGSYLIFKSMRPGGYGGADLYISFKRKDGSWTGALNLGPTINTAFAERFPSVSRDGRFFFFGSDRDGNAGDIFWMDAGFIERMRSLADIS
jgi:ankyrin repeat protein